LKKMIDIREKINVQVKENVKKLKKHKWDATKLTITSSFSDFELSSSVFTSKLPSDLSSRSICFFNNVMLYFFFITTHVFFHSEALQFPLDTKIVQWRDLADFFSLVHPLRVNFFALKTRTLSPSCISFFFIFCDIDLVQAFLKKWWVESDFKAPNLPLSLRFKGSGCHCNSI
jgi:hypothetical protein